MEITIATVDDRARVIDTVLAAFASDPAYTYFFGDVQSEPYRGYAAVFSGSLFDRRVGLGTVWLADGGAAAALWNPPKPFPVPESTLDLPDDVVARLAAYDAAVHPLLADEPHWYLGVLATHPDVAGRRWGRAVMAAGLDRAAADGCPAYLETTNPRNVEIYGRAGWRVAGQTAIPTSTVDLPIWVMTHSAYAAERPQ